MASRKRVHEEISSDAPAQSPTLLTQIRSTWHFAGLMQYIQIFGSALKIDNELDIDMLEEECLKPNSERLALLGLTMLKWVSSHRGLTLDIFDEYTRRQYLAKAPHLNLFGEEEDALKFADMDIFTKLKVLHQLSVWTLNNPDRIRERMEESTDKEQASWRVEPIGQDREDRQYYLLDDNRLYRLTAVSVAKPQPKKAKAKPKPKKSGSRSSKRRRTTSGDASESDDEVEEAQEADQVDENNGLGGAKWECLAVTLAEYGSIIEKFRKSKNANEKEMVETLEDQAMPELLRAEESKARKEQRRQKELDGLQKMATAKRSSRLADKQEKQRVEDEAKVAEMKKQDELAMAHKEQERQMRQERDRESRMMTREQRIRDREMRRILNEEELSNLQERSQSVDSSEAARMSERNRTTLLQKKQKDLEKIKEEEQDDWDFDCEKCGVHGKNIDDGSHSIACDRCNVWQHIRCNNITPQQAERDDFKFVCSHCQKPKSNITLKLKGKQPSPLGMTVTPTSETAAANVKPTVQVPQPGFSSSPPMGMFKTTPPIAAARPPSANGYGYPQQAYPQLPSHMNPYAGSSPTTNGYPSVQPPQGHHPSQPSQHPYSPSYANYQRPPGYPPPSPAKQYQHSAYSPYPQQQPLIARPPSQPRPPSSNSASTPNGITTSQAQPKPLQSPLTNGVSPNPQPAFQSPAHHAPAPSLSATQGNTSLRFSPTTQPPTSPHRHNPPTLANSPHAAHAYSPSSALPQHGGASPVKLASPPHSSFGTNPSSSFPTPKSPLKTSFPPTQQTPSSSMGMNLDGAPTLSPSVNANGVSNAVPVKKATPVKSPVLQVMGEKTAVVNGVGYEGEQTQGP